MWAVLWIGTALAAGRWDGLPSDVVVEAELSLSPEQVTAAFSDARVVVSSFATTCTRKVSARSDREVSLVWHPSWVRRPVVARVDDVSPGRRVDWSFDGKLGFFFVVEAVPRGDGSTVTLTTPLYAPKWPLRRLYHQQIRPAWATCYADVLSRLDPTARVVRLTGPVE